MWATRFLTRARIPAQCNITDVFFRQYSDILSNRRQFRISKISTNQFVYVLRGYKKNTQVTGSRRPDEFRFDDIEENEDYSDGFIEPNKRPQQAAKNSKEHVKKKKKQHKHDIEDWSDSETVNVVEDKAETQKKKVTNNKQAKRSDQSKAILKEVNQKTIHVYDPELNLSYVKLRHNHPELQAFMMMAKSKLNRAKNHLLVVEGRRLLLDALEAGLQLKYVLFSRPEQMLKINHKLKEANVAPQIVRVPHHDLGFWSVMTTCPGIIGIFQKPVDMQPIFKRAAEKSQLNQMNSTINDEMNEEVNDNAPRTNYDDMPLITVIIDQMTDASNLGSVIRSCAAIPCKQVILTKGCADPWDPKALRGGAGGQFRLPIYGPMDWKSIGSFLPDEYSFYIADNYWVPEMSETIRDGHTEDNNTLDQGFGDIRTLPYISVPFYKCKHVVLTIAGGTNRVDPEAYHLLAELRRNWKNQGDLTAPTHHTIKIPLANNVPSLNSNTAVSILLFEIRRQMTK